MWNDLWNKCKAYKNVILVSTLIGSMLLFMIVTVIYVSSQVANCSSAKKVKNICFKIERKVNVNEKIV